MNKERISLVLTAVLFYGYNAIFSTDNEYKFYMTYLTIFSGLYHYKDEKEFFEEDLICCCFIKLYLLCNYIWWLEWSKLFYYFFCSDIFGNIIFYISYKSWYFKQKNRVYLLIHNFWHFYTAYMINSVIKNENKVYIGNITYFLRITFILLLISYNLKNNYFIKIFIVFSFLLPGTPLTNYYYDKMVL